MERSPVITLLFHIRVICEALYLCVHVFLSMVVVSLQDYIVVSHPLFEFFLAVL